MSEFKLGEHESAIRQLLLDSTQTRRDIAEIRDILAVRRGERRSLALLGGVAGAVFAAIVQFARAKWFHA